MIFNKFKKDKNGRMSDSGIKWTYYDIYRAEGANKKRAKQLAKEKLDYYKKIEKSTEGIY